MLLDYGYTTKTLDELTHIKCYRSDRRIESLTHNSCYPRIRVTKGVIYGSTFKERIYGNYLPSV